MKMTKNLIGALALCLVIMLSACPTGGDDNEGGLSYNDTPVAAFTGTRWTDDIVPESTITFTSATSVTLEGRYWAQVTGFEGSHTYETASSLEEDEVAPAVWVIIDADKRTGFEIDYYKADTDTGKHQRLVVWTGGSKLLQPREFYRH